MPDTLLQDTVTDGSSYANIFFNTQSYFMLCAAQMTPPPGYAVSEFHLSLVWTGHQSPTLSHDTHATAGPLP